MPPMPPAPGAPAAAAFLSSSLISAMRASVVSIRPAMEAAFCSARRVTLAGSMTPIFTIAPYSPDTALQQLFVVVIAGSVFDLRTDLLHTAFDIRGLAGAFDDRGVVLIDGDLLGAAEVLKLDVLQLDAEVFGDGLAAGEGGDVFEHGLAACPQASAPV